MARRFFLGLRTRGGSFAPLGVSAWNLAATSGLFAHRYPRSAWLLKGMRLLLGVVNGLAVSLVRVGQERVWVVDDLALVPHVLMQLVLQRLQDRRLCRLEHGLF